MDAISSSKRRGRQRKKAHLRIPIICSYEPARGGSKAIGWEHKLMKCWIHPPSQAAKLLLLGDPLPDYRADRDWIIKIIFLSLSLNVLWCFNKDDLAAVGGASSRVILPIEYALAAQQLGIEETWSLIVLLFGSIKKYSVPSIKKLLTGWEKVKWKSSSPHSLCRWNLSIFSQPRAMHSLHVEP